MGIRVAMVDADLIGNGTHNQGTKHPNLAQMKMSSFCKKWPTTTEVKLVFDDELKHLNEYDLIVISKVFTFNKLPSEVQQYIPQSVSEMELLNISIRDALKKAQKPHDSPIVAIGGTGFFPNGGINQDFEIEHSMPDYNLYEPFVQKRIREGYQESHYADYRFFSIGFTTRGCFRRCSFCVNKKYKKVVKNSPVSEFLDINRPKIYLWDDNFFGYGEGWEEILNELNMTGKPFQFRQGLDIRLMTDKRARIISQSNWYGDFIFAFDHIRDEDLIVKRLGIWKKYYEGMTKFYVLCSYAPFDPDVHPPGWVLVRDKPDEKEVLQDIGDTFRRIMILMKYGCLPYIMRYETWRTSKYRDILVQLARWCNQPQFFKKMSFRQFCTRHLDYAANKDRCLPYTSMIKFEKDHPDIAKKYFDLRFEDVCEYDRLYSFGRIKHEPCSVCRVTSITWADAYRGDNQFIFNYLGRTLDLNCLRYCKKTCQSKKRAVETILSGLCNLSVAELKCTVKQSFPITAIKSMYVPKITKFEDYTNNLIECIGEKTILCQDLGRLLKKKPCSANNNYGRNCAEIAALMDLVFLDKIKGESKSAFVVSLTPLAKWILKQKLEDRLDLYRRLILRIPVVQQAIIRDVSEDENSIALFLNENCSCRVGKSSQTQLSVLLDIMDNGFSKEHF